MGKIPPKKNELDKPPKPSLTKIYCSSLLEALRLKSSLRRSQRGLFDGGIVFLDATTRERFPKAQMLCAQKKFCLCGRCEALDQHAYVLQTATDLSQLPPCLRPVEKPPKPARLAPAPRPAARRPAPAAAVPATGVATD
jgi:hypothetical protein